jgi:hypothetical protein
VENPGWKSSHRKEYEILFPFVFSELSRRKTLNQIGCGGIQCIHVAGSFDPKAGFATDLPDFRNPQSGQRPGVIKNL